MNHHHAVAAAGAASPCPMPAPERRRRVPRDTLHQTIMQAARALMLAGAVALPLGAHAVYQCNVQVNAVLVYADGSVNLLHSGRGDYTVICNLNTEYQGVSPLTCATWTAMLQHIKKNNGTANIYYNGEGSCATLPTYWQAPAPVYIGNM